jgi:hypothetical protein
MRVPHPSSQMSSTQAPSCTTCADTRTQTLQIYDMGIFTGTTKIPCVDCCGPKELAGAKAGFCYCKGEQPTEFVNLPGKVAIVCKTCRGVVSI